VKLVSISCRNCPATYKHNTETILEDENYKALREFTSVYGIGPVTARTLLVGGCRTLDDVKKFYENPERTIQEVPDDDKNEFEDETRGVPESWIEVSLALRDDLSVK